MSIDQQFAERSLRTADGLTLSFRDYGSRFSQATPVLCLPGLTRNVRDFTDLAASLMPDRRVISLDARGRGKSDFDPDYTSYTLVREVGDTLTLISQEFERPCIIVGTSRGGLAGMILNGVRPDLVGGLVLNDIGPELEPAGLQRIVEYLGITPTPLNTWDDAVRALKKSNSSEFTDLTEADWLAWAHRTFRDEDGRPGLDYDPKLRDATLSASVGVSDFWPQFRGLGDKPTLLIRGENSDLLSTGTVAKMRRTKPDMTVVTVRNRGHVPFLDEPEAKSAILAFIAEVDGRANPS